MPKYINETREHNELKSLFRKSLEDWSIVSIKEYYSGGHQLDVYGVTKDNISIYIEIIWSISMQHYQSDMLIIHRSNADVKIVIGSPKIIEKNERDFIKTVIQQRGAGIVIHDKILDGQRILDDANYFNTEVKRLIADLFEQARDKRRNELKGDKGNTVVPSVLLEKPKIDLTIYNSIINSIPPEYINRTITHFSFLSDDQYSILLKKERNKLDKIVMNKKKIVLLGDGGSGKSTELKKFLKTVIENEAQLIPSYKHLDSYIPQQELESTFLNELKRIPDKMHLVIWDGLDEIISKDFSTVIRQIITFSEKHPETTIVISCRTNFYELPVDKSLGTLPGFEPYFINDFNWDDVREYYVTKYDNEDPERFINEVLNNKFSDIITKPFFLMILSDVYHDKHNLHLNRAELFESFLISRIKFDEVHFQTAYKIREKKKEINKILQKVALSMEVLANNAIKEDDLLSLISIDEFDTLKHCAVFKKSDGHDNLWQFEHNNIQEYLAAKALSKVQFDEVIKFISFEPDYSSLNPSWINTLAFLFSILKPEDELFERLLNWLQENCIETIVKFEKDRISESFRDQVFQQIFNDYKSKDIWIYSNKFIDRDLARFGQTEANIQFIINEIENGKNSETVIINAINLIGHFEIQNIETRNKVIYLLLNFIDKNIDTPHLIDNVIYAFKWAKITDQDSIHQIMDRVGQQKNQRVRSALYALLAESEHVNDYVDYLIEGYELLYKSGIPGREDISLIDESYNLRECVKKIKTPSSLKKLIGYIAKSNRFDRTFDSDKIFAIIIKNSIDAYKKDKSMYDVILDLFFDNIRYYRSERNDTVLSFFNNTGMREKTFFNIWNSSKIEDRDKSHAIAKLATPKLLEFVIEQFNNHIIKDDDLVNIYYDMLREKNESFDLFKNMIKEKTNYQLEEAPQVDWEMVRQRKIQEEFDLLFNEKDFLNATIKVFLDEKKEELTFEDLSDVRMKNKNYVNLEEFYSGLALRLLRALCRENQLIQKDKVLQWFNRKEFVEWYCVSTIYDYLTHHKEISISHQQQEWIENWCRENIESVDFKNSITVNSNGNTSFKVKAIYIWYFSRRFDIGYSDDILLNMLSFDYFEEHGHGGIEFLVSKLDKSDVRKRIIENIKRGIEDHFVFINQIKYAFENNLYETYYIISNEIVNQKRKDYDRRDILDIYFESTHDIQGIKNLLEKADFVIKWRIVDLLKDAGETVFLEEYLLTVIKNDSIDEKEKLKASEYLITIQNIDGLRYFVNWIKGLKENSMDSRQLKCLNKLNSKNPIPLLFDLLEISYQKEITTDGYGRFNSYITGALTNVALVSDDNFDLVINKMKKFISENLEKYPDVKYLNVTIERISDQFYLEKAQSYTIEEVKEKVKYLFN